MSATGEDRRPNPLGDRHSNTPSDQRTTPAATAGFRWTCPYCGDSRVNASDGESGRTNSIAAVRAHVYATDGADHGPRNAHPEDFDAMVLSDHVVRVAGRE